MQEQCDIAIENAVRYAIAAGRYAEIAELHDLSKKYSHNDMINLRGSIFLIHQNSGTTVSGHGEIFRTFMQCTKIQGYKGKTRKFRFFKNDKENPNGFKVMLFREAFSHLDYDVRDRE